MPTYISTLILGRYIGRYISFIDENSCCRTSIDTSSGNAGKLTPNAWISKSFNSLGKKLPNQNRTIFEFKCHFHLQRWHAQLDRMQQLPLQIYTNPQQSWDW